MAQWGNASPSTVVRVCFPLMFGCYMFNVKIGWKLYAMMPYVYSSLDALCCPFHLMLTGLLGSRYSRYCLSNSKSLKPFL